MSVEHCALDRGRYEQLIESMEAATRQAAAIMAIGRAMVTLQALGDGTPCPDCRPGLGSLCDGNTLEAPSIAVESLGQDIAVKHKHMLAILDSGRWDETPESEV